MIAGRLDNIDVVCTAIEPMRRFYVELLGLSLRLPYEPGQGWIGLRAGDVVIYLIEEDAATLPPHPAPRFTGAANPPGFDSFAFEVDRARRRDHRARRARRRLGGRDRRVRVVSLPRTARPRGQPRVPDRAAARPSRPAGPGTRRSGDVIDCDVHNVVGPIETLEPYLDDHWREVIATSQFAGPTDQAHPPNLATSLRDDLAPVDGAAPGRTRGGAARPRARRARRPGGDPRLRLRGRERAQPRRRGRAGDSGQRLAAAPSGSSPSRGCARRSSSPPSSRPRRSPRSSGGPDDPRFVAVYLPVRSPIPYGNRIWWPLWEAIERHELVAELHFGGSAGIAADRLGMADLVAGGVRRHGVGVRFAADQPDRRGDAGSLRAAADLADRIRLRLAAGLHVAVRQGLARACGGRSRGRRGYRPSMCATIFGCRCSRSTDLSTPPSSSA